jgi:16S rRNA (cytosine1402-N4)-methyltransferase
MQLQSSWGSLEFNMRHIPVLLEEVISFVPKSTLSAVDCTVGDAGHSEEILKSFPEIHLLGLDTDKEAIVRAQNFLKKFGKRAKVVQSNFAEIKKIARKENFGKVDFLLADLGWSSPQFAERGRGLSFQHLSEPLDMRFNVQSGITAAEFLNKATEKEIGEVFRKYGEEKQWRTVAKAVIEARPVKTVKDLVEVVESCKKRGKTHAATLIFQALRIYVNDELVNLEKFLKDSLEVVSIGGVIAIITFHSLEDRIVKEFFAKHKSVTQTLSKKPITATTKETKNNPRSRSAKFRVYKKTNH